ncbi:gustatory receptor for sugar taste 64f-like [Aethina tumida]|uniref:gustatory receptor for sugar taste 64f-like n=1 Tax=Aethina tumida TaxID=116153 RepID=UPI0021492FA1|nr:gustatory receptor for sugar taste 64f-like [Aethina tumida]
MKILKKTQSDVALAIEPDAKMTSFQKSSFQENIKFFIIIGQCFGLMPLEGITNKNVRELKFTWKSWKFLYCLYNISGAFVTMIFCCIKFTMYGLTIDELAPFMFYVWNFFAGVQMIQICRNWTHLLKEWSIVEMSMRNYSFIFNLKRKFVSISLLVMTIALTEHILFITNAVIDATHCSNFNEMGFEIYFRMAFPHYFKVVPFSVAMAIFSEIANILCTFTWNYTDIFIILICTSLTARFTQINRRLKYNKAMHEQFFKEVRIDYNRLTHLTYVVDKLISPLVMVSYIDNIIFLCIQLYQSLKERSGPVETLYFFYSFGFLVLRTITVSMYGAWLYDATKKPLRYLCSVPSEYYCNEVDRFVQQVASTRVGISGSRFFILNRTFLLRMAGTIITIELMIFQFGPKIDNSVSYIDKCVQ